MKQYKLLSFLFLGAMIVLFASCSNTNKEGRYIPKEAAVVLLMNGESLSSKLPWSEIKENPLFKEAYADTTMPAALKSMMDDPENAGIDPKSDIIFFMVKDSLGGYFAVEGNVKDMEKFKAFNLLVSENGTESEQDDVQYISKNPVCVGYTKDKFIYLINAPQMNQRDDLSKRMMRDSIDIPAMATRDIGATCKSIFALAESNSLAKSDKFTSLMKDKGDIQFWLNFEEVSEYMPSNTPIAMLNMDKFTKGNVTTGIINFENGKMEVKMKSYASNELMKIFKNYGGGKINEDMIKRLPSKNVIGMMALNFKPEGVRELIKLTGFDGFVNIGMQKFGFTLDDFVKANKGDVVVAFSDLAIKTDTTTFNFQDQDPNFSMKKLPTGNFIFAASVGDKDAFNKLINAGKNLGQGKINDSIYPIAYNTDGKYFAISNKKENVDQYLGSSNTDFDFLSKITGEPFGGYLNIQALMKSMSGEIMKSTDSVAKVAYDASLAMWDNITWKGGEYDDGGIKQTVEINLMDKSTNSLKQLNMYAAKMALIAKQQQDKRKAEMQHWDEMEDSTAMPSMKK